MTTDLLLKQRILGIDPGLRCTGYGIIDVLGRNYEYIASGVIRTPSEYDLSQRLGILANAITQLLGEHNPDVAAVEKVFVNINPKSTLALGHARGALVATLVVGGVSVHEYTALQVKQSLVGYGRAQKHQMQEMVSRLLKLDKKPSSDAADALAVAIIHCHHMSLSGLSVNTMRKSRRGRWMSL